MTGDKTLDNSINSIDEQTLSPAEQATRLARENDTPAELHDTLDHEINVGDPTVLATMSQTDFNTALENIFISDNETLPPESRGEQIQEFAQQVSSLPRETLDDMFDELEESNPALFESIFAQIDTQEAQATLAGLAAQGAGPFINAFTERAEKQRTENNARRSTADQVNALNTIEAAMDWLDKNLQREYEAAKKRFIAAETPEEEQEAANDFAKEAEQAAKDKGFSDEAAREAAMKKTEQMVIEGLKEKNPNWDNEQIHERAKEIMDGVRKDLLANDSSLTAEQIEAETAKIVQQSGDTLIDLSMIEYYTTELARFKMQLNELIEEKLVHVDIDGQKYAVESAKGIDPETGRLVYEGDGEDKYYYYDENASKWVEASDTQDIEQQIADGRLLANDPEIVNEYITAADFVNVAQEELDRSVDELKDLKSQIDSMPDGVTKDYLTAKVQELEKELAQKENLVEHYEDRTAHLSHVMENEEKITNFDIHGFPFNLEEAPREEAENVLADLKDKTVIAKEEVHHLKEKIGIPAAEATNDLSKNSVPFYLRKEHPVDSEAQESTEVAETESQLAPEPSENLLSNGLSREEYARSLEGQEVTLARLKQDFPGALDSELSDIAHGIKATAEEEGLNINLDPELKELIQPENDTLAQGPAPQQNTNDPGLAAPGAG